MKVWLQEQEDRQNQLFDNLLKITQYSIQNILKDENILFRVIFEKDKWLDNGTATIEILQKDIDEQQDVFYKLKKTYRHSVYNQSEDIDKKNIVKDLMKEGIFTNSWFSVLDSSRKYDTEILFSKNGYVLENSNCEDAENRKKSTHTGFNGFDKKAKKMKP